MIFGPLPGGSLLVSRVDVYADTQGWNPSVDDFDRMMTRATRRTLYQEEVTVPARCGWLDGVCPASRSVAERSWPGSMTRLWN